MGLIPYAAVVSLSAILLAYQVYASSNTPFLNIIYNHSVLTILSPVRLRPVIKDVLASLFSLSWWANAIKLPPAYELLGSCLTIFTQESLHTLVSAAQWATDKMFTCEISYMVTIAITSFFNKFFNITYLRIFISTASLLVSSISILNLPTEHNSVHAARQQFRYRICALCSTIFTAIEYVAFALVTLSTLRDMARNCGGPRSRKDCGYWWVAGYSVLGVMMTVIGSYTIGKIIWASVENVLESWRFVEVSRDKEAARSRVETDDTMERVGNVMKQSGRFMEDEREEQIKEEILQEIVRLYEVDETWATNNLGSLQEVEFKINS